MNVVEYSNYLKYLVQHGVALRLLPLLDTEEGCFRYCFLLRHPFALERSLGYEVQMKAIDAADCVY